MKIMILDDSRFVTHSVQRYIKDAGFQDVEYITINDSKNAIEVFKKESPDMMFLDLLMPNVTGEEILEELRSLEHHCYIVVLSSNFQTPVKERVMKLGANLFIEKTINVEKIAKVISQYESYKNN